MSHETPIVVAPRPVRFFTRSDDFKVSFNDPALEEFLSILKPSLVASTAISRRLTSPIHISPSAELKDIQIDAEASRNWLASTLLSSPVSRVHTRNPFQRRRDLTPAPLSPVIEAPAAIPLPPPTPSELVVE